MHGHLQPLDASEEALPVTSSQKLFSPKFFQFICNFHHVCSIQGVINWLNIGWSSSIWILLVIGGVVTLFRYRQAFCIYLRFLLWLYFAFTKLQTEIIIQIEAVKLDKYITEILKTNFETSLI